MTTSEKIRKAIKETLIDLMNSEIELCEAADTIGDHETAVEICHIASLTSLLIRKMLTEEERETMGWHVRDKIFELLAQSVASHQNKGNEN